MTELIKESLKPPGDPSAELPPTARRAARAPASVPNAGPASEWPAPEQK
jgi:hypothetical protein